jgi:hypothetical protein
MSSFSIFSPKKMREIEPVGVSVCPQKTKRLNSLWQKRGDSPSPCQLKKVYRILSAAATRFVEKSGILLTITASEAKRYEHRRRPLITHPLQQRLRPVLQALLHLVQKLMRDGAIHNPMIVRQSHVTHGPNGDRIVDHYWSFFNRT